MSPYMSIIGASIGGLISSFSIFSHLNSLVNRTRSAHVPETEGEGAAGGEQLPSQEGGDYQELPRRMPRR